VANFLFLQMSLEYMIMDSITSNLQGISQRIAQAAQTSGRSAAAPVTLIAVSKTKPLSQVITAADAKQVDFGENYVQEGVDKIKSLRSSHPQLVWHMIGPLQSNKTRLVAEHFDWVHTIDRSKIAQRLSEQRPPDIDDEATKSGVLPDQVLPMAHELSALPRLKLRGLMCIPARDSGSAFKAMKELFSQCQQSGVDMDVLSMGMSEDFENAIAHGATHIRVGSAIFGARNYL
jgi:PLP dependent protein